jgi:signal peptidase I
MGAINNLLLGRTKRGAVFRVSLLLVLLLFPIFRLFETLYVSGDSMYPTYKNGNILLIQKMHAINSDWVPQKYDTVCINISYTEEWIKRVIGLPGDHIQFGSGKVWINGKRDKLYEYLNPNEIPRSTVIMVDLIVPENHVWIIGDNRYDSAHKLIPISDIKGKVVHRQ